MPFPKGGNNSNYDKYCGNCAYFKYSTSNPSLKSMLFSGDFRALSWVSEILNLKKKN